MHAIARGFTLLMLLAGCAAPSAGPLGLDQAPAGLDPNSPTISSIDLAYDKTEIRVPAAREFTLIYLNRDKLPHNVSIYRDAAHRERVFEGIVFDGPTATRWYPVPALAPGTYFFQCDIHPIPMMQGTISAGL